MSHRATEPIDRRGLTRELRDAAMSLGNVPERLHEQARIIAHLFDRGIQIGHDIFLRVEVFAGPMAFTGIRFSC